MTNDKQETRTEKWLRIFKNNPIVAALIIISLVISGITVFSEFTSKAYKLFFPVTYDSQYKKTVNLIKSDDPAEKIEGISLLQELTRTYPSGRQKLVDFLQTYVTKNFPQDKEIDKKYLPVLYHAIRTITTLPRMDENSFPLKIDIHQIRIENLDLSNTNFQDVSLWGGQFINVIFSRSNFQNADLGGTQFKNCSLEYAKLEGAKITGSFMDQENGRPRPTRFINTRLYGSTIEKAQLDFCEVIGITDYPVDKLRKCAIR